MIFQKVPFKKKNIHKDDEAHLEVQKVSLIDWEGEVNGIGRPLMNDISRRGGLK